MNEFIMISGMVAVTYLIRYPIMPLLDRISLPPALFDALRYVPPAVLASIIAPALLMPDGTIEITPDNIHLVAGLIAIIVAWFTKHLMLTIIVGMVCLWVLQSTI
ncbi:MAG: AzlD domain-containing protein [Chloroflexota bacterium]